MQDIPLYPLLFHPVYKSYIWGGSRINALYNRNLPPGVYAESWEIADRPEGMSVVRNGALAGRDLYGLLKLFGPRLTGRQCGEFPLLIKILDAREKLSVQVHPDESTARETGGDPKTEMWYVLQAEPGAEIYAGLKPGVTASSFRQALQKGDVIESLRAVRVARGDVIFIPGGRVHVLGPGCLLLEVMQNSDTTYRLFDWNRVGPDGNPRALQVNKALKAIRWDDSASPKVEPGAGAARPDRGGNTTAELLKTDFFKFEKISLVSAVSCATGGKTFHVLFVEEGRVDLSWDAGRLPLEIGTTALVPAGMSEYSIASARGPATVLRISLP